MISPSRSASAAYSPSFEAIQDLPTMMGTVAVSRELLSDLDTPVSVYLKLRGPGSSFLLESVEGGERVGRYSFIGNGSWRWELSPPSGHQVTHGPGPADALIPSVPALQPLRTRLNAMRPALPNYEASVSSPFQGGGLGYLAYEAIRHAENVPVPEHDVLGLPDASFMGVDDLVIYDHVRHTIRVVAHMRLDEPRALAYADAVERIEDLVRHLSCPGVAVDRVDIAEPAPRYQARYTSNITQRGFESMVRAAKSYIRSGDILQVVLSQRLTMPLSDDPFTLYRRLRALSPSPYMYFIDFGDHQLVGASPELLVQLESGQLTSRPIAGTRRRGADDSEDRALAAELLADEKERAEHIMLVDLARNDLGRIAIPGTVEVGKLMEIERFSHVMHIVSDVTATLRSDCSTDDALWSTFPAGTVSGAPKIRAMEIIAELESDRRGPYAGAVGFLAPTGGLEFAITIRTAVVKDGEVHVQAGAGIVADSVPGREYEETLNKARALLLAAGG